jgi:hypothetical protein
MVIAFQKNDPNLFPKLIRWWTKSPYSHCEIIFTNGLTFSADCNSTGIRTKFKTSNHNTVDWDFVKIPVDAETEAKLFRWATTEAGCLYDFVGIVFTQILPLSFQNPWWWFCSELCTAFLQQAGLLTDLIAYKLNPGQLFKILDERGYKINE